MSFFPLLLLFQGAKTPLLLILETLFFLYSFLTHFSFKFMYFIVQKTVVFINIPANCIQHKFLVDLFCRTVMKPTEFFVFFYVPKCLSVCIERIWRFSIPFLLCMLAWDSSFSLFQRSLTFMTLFFSASFSALYLYKHFALCPHPLQSAHSYTPKVCVYPSCSFVSVRICLNSRPSWHT